MVTEQDPLDILALSNLLVVESDMHAAPGVLVDRYLHLLNAMTVGGSAAEDLRPSLEQQREALDIFHSRGSPAPLFDRYMAGIRARIADGGFGLGEVDLPMKAFLEEFTGGEMGEDVDAVVAGFHDRFKELCADFFLVDKDRSYQDRWVGLLRFAMFVERSIVAHRSNRLRRHIVGGLLPTGLERVRNALLHEFIRSASPKAKLGVMSWLVASRLCWSPPHTTVCARGGAVLAAILAFTNTSKRVSEHWTLFSPIPGKLSPMVPITFVHVTVRSLCLVLCVLRITQRPA